MRRKKTPVTAAPPRDTSADENLLRELYLKDPCRILPRTLWKVIRRLPSLEAHFLEEGGITTGVELREPGKILLYGTRTQNALKAASVKLDGVPRVLIHDDFVKPLAPWFDHKKSFLRMIHRGSDLPLRSSEPGLSLREVDPATELPLVATILHACYDTPTPGTDEIAAWTRRSVYDPHLWLWITDRHTKQPVALGIAEADMITREGSIEWIQVLPEQRERGLGAMLLQELVYRLERKTMITTASWETRNPCHPERLFEMCGFTGHDIWWLLQR